MIALSAAMRNVTIGFLVLFSVAARAQNSFSDHYDKSQQLWQNDQYQAALEELDAAYQLRQLPRLLYDIARAHQALGHVPQAIDYFRRFLAADTGAEPDVRGDAERRLQSLRALAAADAPPPPPPPQPFLQMRLPQPAVRYEMHADRSMIAGGAALLATSYLAASISASIFVGLNGSDGPCNAGSGTNNTCLNYQTAGGVLFIPLLGPFISAGGAGNASWSVPWAMVDGMAQIAGLAMIIAGVRNKHKVPVYGDRINLAPTASATSAGVSLTGRF